MKMLSRVLVVLTFLSSFNAHALIVKLDFETLGSTDMWGDVTNNFDVTQAGFSASSFSSITNSILAAVQEDFYSSAYGFINSNQELDIDFMIASVSDDVSGIDANNYTIQIGSTASGSGSYGQACLSCISGPGGVPNFSVSANTIFGSVFSDNIFSGLTAAAGASWDIIEAVNAIAGTLSHEIGHGLGLPHPAGPEANPGESAYGVMATGAFPSSMPSSQRLLNRAFSDVNMLTLVNNLGLRSVAVPEPTSIVLFLLAGALFVRSQRVKPSH